MNTAATRIWEPTALAHSPSSNLPPPCHGEPPSRQEITRVLAALDGAPTADGGACADHDHGIDAASTIALVLIGQLAFLVVAALVAGPW